MCNTIPADYVTYNGRFEQHNIKQVFWEEIYNIVILYSKRIKLLAKVQHLATFIKQTITKWENLLGDGREKLLRGQGTGNRP